MMLWRDLQALWPHLSPHRRRTLWWVLGLMLLGALAELVSMGAIVPFKRAVYEAVVAEFRGFLA